MGADEAASWREVLAAHYRSAYGLALHPLQSDPAIVPPRGIVDVVQGRDKDDPTTFFGTGYREAFRYVSTLHAHGQCPTRMERMLDFGVGTGRVLVHFLPFALQRFGCDITPEALAWTSGTLGAYASLQLTASEPPLPFPDAHFDLILATSVFTHLAYAAQPVWIRELARVLRPGGSILATLHAKLPASAAARGWHERYQDRGIHRRTYLAQPKALELWSAALTVVDLDTPAAGQGLVMATKPIPRHP
ncbi:MAG: class I SAM-dependent methyltransferase [Candidatus Binatia bacterium]